MFVHNVLIFLSSHRLCDHVISNASVHFLKPPVCLYGVQQRFIPWNEIDLNTYTCAWFCCWGGSNGSSDDRTWIDEKRAESTSSSLHTPHAAVYAAHLLRQVRGTERQTEQHHPHSRRRPGCSARGDGELILPEKKPNQTKTQTNYQSWS